MSIVDHLVTTHPCFLPGSSTESVALFNWTQFIQGEGLTLHAVTSEKSVYFDVICKMYGIEDEALLINDLKKITILWCICDENENPIGGIQIDYYASLSDLRNQVSDKQLAQSLFNRGKVLELSYSLKEEKRGLGYGTRAVKAWIDDAKEHEWGKHLFAVTASDNISSQKILGKNAFSPDGEYIHETTKDQILLYSLK